MSVLLAILKGIGLVILALVLLVLFFLFLVLFVPFRYRLEGSFEKKLTVRGKVSWLFRLAAVEAGYDGALTYRLKIAGIPFEPGKIKQSRLRRAIRRLTDGIGSFLKKVGRLFVKSTAPPAEEEKEPEGAAPQPEPAQPVESVQPSKPVQPSEPSQPSEPPEQDGETSADQKETFSFERLGEKLETAQEKLEDIRENLRYYLDLFEQTDTRIAVCNILRQTGRMLRHILPKKLEAHLIVGTGDPASMGQLMAAWGILYPLLYGSVWLEPDFEQKRTDAALTAQGRIRVVSLLFLAFRILLKKEMIHLLKRLRRKKEE